MKNTKQPKRCSKCNGTPDTYFDLETQWVSMKCMDCGHQTEYRQSERKAINSWNKGN